ncbi:MAG TPA: hypothetical protein VKM72_15920 [Thermoanaerobaculia bacterium]|nr:hypothetical protein [Thermoanaerobaculia bacterium]
MPPRHDRLFKRVLRFFLPDLLRLVVPSLALGKRRSSPVFLDKELLEEDRREADILARFPMPGGGSVLVHVEVEARSRTRMLRRLREYAGRIQARYGGPVLSILVNLRGGTPGIHTMAPDGEIAGPGLNCFRYLAFNLSGCRAEDYLSKPEPLAWGLAPLMTPGRWSRAEHKLACLQRIDAGRLDEQRRLLLVDCVETYLVLTPEEMEEYKRLSPREREKPMNPMRDLTWSERMIADGMRQIVLHQMDQRFGPLPEPIRKKVEGIYSATRLTRLADKLLIAGSLEELGIR